MSLPSRNPSHNIGFISTRFAGTDGVSLETAKWASVLEERLGQRCFYFSGFSDRPAERSRVLPEVYYRHPDIESINQIAFAADWQVAIKARAEHPELVGLVKDSFSVQARPATISRQVQEIKETIKESLYAFARDFELELLIIENALSIPVHLPLGLDRKSVV